MLRWIRKWFFNKRRFTSVDIGDRIQFYGGQTYTVMESENRVQLELYRSIHPIRLPDKGGWSNRSWADLDALNKDLEHFKVREIIKRSSTE
ncbi:hypothetical protein EQV77_04480 [Halobacillus fulvus]|nr:hypothetical protein EQV77_04480 [Halobacillus fulvus]